MDLDFNDKGLIGYLWKMSLQVPIFCLKRDMGFSEGACNVERYLKSATPTSVIIVLSRPRALAVTALHFVGAPAWAMS